MASRAPPDMVETPRFEARPFSERKYTRLPSRPRGTAAQLPKDCRPAGCLTNRAMRWKEGTQHDRRSASICRCVVNGDFSIPTASWQFERPLTNLQPARWKCQKRHALHEKQAKARGPKSAMAILPCRRAGVRKGGTGSPGKRLSNQKSIEVRGAKSSIPTVNHFLLIARYRTMRLSFDFFSGRTYKLQSRMLGTNPSCDTASQCRKESLNHEGFAVKKGLVGSDRPPQSPVSSMRNPTL